MTESDRVTGDESTQFKVTENGRAWLENHTVRRYRVTEKGRDALATMAVEVKEPVPTPWRERVMIAKRPYPQKETASTQRVARILWILLYLQEHRYMRYENARSGLGLCRRTYHRYLSVLREAGVIMDFDFGNQCVRYFCFDTDMAPVLGVRGA